ncbi:hypothetical protein LINPERHAP2_LOCUS42008, partial [Linum perenne]
MNTLVADKKINLKCKFNPGAYEELERLMLVDKPACGVKTDPNIVSRVKTLKAKCHAIQELRGLSGAGWDEASHCAKLNRVPFSLYDGLAFVFGKPRATGKGPIGSEELNKVCPPIEEPQGLKLDWINPTECKGELETGDEGNNPSNQNNPPTTAIEPTPIPPTEKATPSEASSQPKRMRRSTTTSGSEVLELKPILEDVQELLNKLHTKFRVRHFLKCYEKFQYHNLTLVELVHRGGIITLRDDSMFEVQVEWIGHFSVVVVLKNRLDDFVWQIVNVYGPQDLVMKRLFVQEITDIWGWWNYPGCVVGDFNMIRSRDESRGSSRSQVEINLFNDCIENLALVDLPLFGAEFTWSDLRQNAVVSKLDRCLISGSWEDMYPNCRVQ